MNRKDIYTLIDQERHHQTIKWAGMHSWGSGDASSTDVADIVKAAVLTEETGEVARAVLDSSPTEALRAELVQVAAVAVAWLRQCEMLMSIS